MKKLRRLHIRLEKQINEKELLTLRGGYSGLTCYYGINNGPAFQLNCSDCAYHFMTIEDTTQHYC